MKNSVSISQVFGRYFNENEIQVIKDAILYGSWGDSEVRFGNDEEDSFGFGYCTNDAKQGGHFAGRQISGLFSSISKKIEKFGINWMVHFPDWWGDGSGDMVFFKSCVLPDDLLGEWARGSEPEVEVHGDVPVEPVPEVQDRWLEDRSYVLKYVRKEDLLVEVDALRSFLLRNGAVHLPEMPGRDATKSEWLDHYELLVEALSLVSQVREVNDGEEPETQAPTASGPKRHNGTAQERLSRYTAELEARVAGTLADLEGRALRKRIASLKRKIARANAAMGNALESKVQNA